MKASPTCSAALYMRLSRDDDGATESASIATHNEVRIELHIYLSGLMPSFKNASRQERISDSSLTFLPESFRNLRTHFPVADALCRDDADAYVRQQREYAWFHDKIYFICSYS